MSTSLILPYNIYPVFVSHGHGYPHYSLTVTDSPLGLVPYFILYRFWLFFSLSREELLIFIIMMWLIYVDTLVNARFISQMLHFLSFRDDF